MAKAMGGLARIETLADREIGISVMLPIAIVPQWQLAPASPKSLIRRNGTSEQSEQTEVLAASTVED
jgi:hypothetical protein